MFEKFEKAKRPVTAALAVAALAGAAARGAESSERSGSDAPKAGAVVEHAGRQEVLSPQAFMATLDKRANILTSDVMRVPSKNLQEVPGKDKILNEAVKMFFPNCEFFSIAMPDPDAKGLYNTLNLIYNPELKKTVEISVSDGMNVPKLQHSVASKESGPSMKFMHNGNDLNYESTGITITNEDKTTNRSGTLGQLYSVGSGYYTSSSFDQINYELHPKAVADQANKFFAAAEVIADYNK